MKFLLPIMLALTSMYIIASELRSIHRRQNQLPTVRRLVGALLLALIGYRLWSAPLFQNGSVFVTREELNGLLILAGISSLVLALVVWDILESLNRDWALQKREMEERSALRLQEAQIEERSALRLQQAQIEERFALRLQEAQIEERFVSAQQEIRRCEGELSHVKQALETMQTEIPRLQGEIATFERVIVPIVQPLSTLKYALQELQNLRRSLQQIQTLRPLLEEIAHVGALSSQVSSLATEVTQTKRDLERILGREHSSSRS